MRHYLLWLVAILGTMLLLAGCDQAYRPKDDGERAIMAYYKENSADGKITNIEKLTDISLPLADGSTATLKRYKVYMQSISDPNTKAAAIVGYDPNTKEIVVQDN